MRRGQPPKESTRGPKRVLRFETGGFGRLLWQMWAQGRCGLGAGRLGYSGGATGCSGGVEMGWEIRCNGKWWLRRMENERCWCLTVRTESFLNEIALATVWLRDRMISM